MEVDCCQLIHLVVLFMYDSVITTGDEIRCFWGKKLTGAAILFWLNKYLTLLYMVWDLGSGFIDITDEVCIVLSFRGRYG